MAKKEDAATIKTQAELARLVERDKSQITRWIRDPRWTFGKPPWAREKLPAILQWIADNLRVDDGDGVAGSPELVELKKQKLAQEIRRLTAMATTAEMTLERERGKLVDGTAAAAEFANVGQVIRNGFQGLAPALLPIALRLGMPATVGLQFTSEVQQHIDGVLAALSREGSDDDGE